MGVKPKKAKKFPHEIVEGITGSLPSVSQSLNPKPFDLFLLDSSKENTVGFPRSVGWRPIKSSLVELA